MVVGTAGFSGGSRGGVGEVNLLVKGRRLRGFNSASVAIGALRILF